MNREMTDPTVPHYADDAVTLYAGDCLAVMRTLPDNSVDSVVTDPPYLLGFMGREWDSRAAHEHLDWHRAWCDEALRVLKPGGMMVSFGGTRTWHRLACAIEDAGFEVRDSIAWIYSQGFPKSLNVSKALAALPTCSCGSTALSGEGVGVIKPDSPASTVGTGVRAEPGTVPLAGQSADLAVGVGPQVLTASADRVTDVRAFNEGVVGESLPVVLGSAAVTGPTEREQVAGLVGGVEVDPEALWDQVMREQTVTPPAVSAGTITGDDARSDVGPAAPLVFPLATAPSGVGRGGEPVAVVDSHAGVRTVDAGVSPAPELIPTDGADVDAVTGTLHAANSTAERAVRCEVCGGVRGKIPAGLGTALKPAHEPIVVARKPLAGTVSQNVLAHGTGGLNVDGCRVEYEAGGNLASNPSLRTHINGGNGGTIFPTEPDRRVVTPNPAGRWPPNVVLDESQAAALDRESGVSRDGVAVRHRGVKAGIYGPDLAVGSTDLGYGGEGGASRFFPTFRYEAKAPGHERPRVDGIAHPTTKPLDLMRFLARLVTPPGGTCLDPFAGSGTTAEACIVEGFRCIAIEREPDYLPLIVARLSKPIQPDLFGGGA